MELLLHWYHICALMHDMYKMTNWRSNVCNGVSLSHVVYIYHVIHGPNKKNIMSCDNNYTEFV